MGHSGVWQGQSTRRTPLGFDRRWNRYWLLGGTDDGGTPKLFVERMTPIQHDEVGCTCHAVELRMTSLMTVRQFASKQQEPVKRVANKLYANVGRSPYVTASCRMTEESATTSCRARSGACTSRCPRSTPSLPS